MAKRRRHFTREFKVEAVRRIADQGKSLPEVARELGLGESLLRAWKQALAKEGDGVPRQGQRPGRRGGTPPAPRRGQAALHGARYFKKATAFFARESS